MATPAPADFLSTADVSARFPWFTENYWARLRCRGDGPTYLRVGNRILYREADIVRWLESHQATSTQETKRRRVAA